MKDSLLKPERCGSLAVIGVVLIACAWSWIRPIYLEPDEGRLCGALLLALGAAALVAAGGVRGRGWVLALAVVAATCLSDALLLRIEATRQPSLGGFSLFASGLLSLIGERVAVEGSQLHLFNGQGAFGYLPTMGLVGFRPLVLALLGAAIAFPALEGRDGWRRMAPWFALVVGAFTLRYAVTVLDYASANSPLADSHHLVLTRFWDPWTILFALSAAAAALHALGQTPQVAPPRGARPAMVVAPLALLAGSSLGFAATWSDPGTPKSGRILIDDRLSGVWEPAGRLLTEDRFGDFSTYSMAAMTEHIARRFSVEVNAERRYTPEYLAHFDVLILKTPYGGLESDEVAAIQDWIEGGGGLFAIGDHTDLSGTSTRLNELTEKYGIRFRFDMTSPTAQIPFDVWSPPWPHEHPVSAGMGSFELMTGCSLDLSGNALPVMTLLRSSSVIGDYSARSHFGKLAARPQEPQGALVVTAAAEVGDGRLLAFADSTVFSSFAYFMDSHSDLSIRAVTWLNKRRSAAANFNLAWLFLGVIAGVLTVLVDRRGVAWLTAIPLAAGAFVIGAGVSSEAGARAVVVPEPQVDIPQVGFVREGGHAWLPPVLGKQPELLPNGNLMTFALTPLRLGMETSVVPRDPRVLADLDVLVLLNPDVEHGQAEAPEGWVPAVRSWVERGGNLVVLQRRGHLACDHVRAPLYVSGLQFEPVASPSPDIELRTAKAGLGRVMHVVGSEALDVDGLGHCMDLPNARQRQRYEASYAIFRGVAETTPEARRIYVP